MALNRPKLIETGPSLVDRLEQELGSGDEPDPSVVSRLIDGQINVADFVIAEHAGDLAARQDVIARIVGMDSDLVARVVGTTVDHERRLFDAARERGKSDTGVIAAMLSRTSDTLARHGTELIDVRQWRGLARTQALATGSYAALSEEVIDVIAVGRSSARLSMAAEADVPRNLLDQGSSLLAEVGAVRGEDALRRTRDLNVAAAWRGQAAQGSSRVFARSLDTIEYRDELVERLYADGIDPERIEQMRLHSSQLDVDERRAVMSALVEVSPDGESWETHPAKISHPGEDLETIEQTSLEEVGDLIDEAEKLEVDDGNGPRSRALRRLHRLTVLINRRAAELDRFWRTGEASAELRWITPSGGEVEIPTEANETTSGQRMAEATYPSHEVATRHARQFADRVVDEAPDSQALREVAERIGEGLGDHNLQRALRDPGGILERGRAAVTQWRTAVVPNVPQESMDRMRLHTTEKEISNYVEDLQEQAQAGDADAGEQLRETPSGETTNIERLPVATSGGKTLTSVAKPGRKKDNKGRGGPQLGG